MATKKLFAHPAGVSREYTRLLMWYARELEKIANETYLADLPALVAQYERDMRGDSYTTDIERTVRSAELQMVTPQYVVTSKLPKVYSDLSRFNEKEFRSVVKSNTGVTLPPNTTDLGVNVFATDVDKRLGEKVSRELWLADNTKFINNMRTQYSDDIEKVIRDGVRNGTSVKDMTKMVRGTEKVNGYSTVNMKLENRAQLIAQDQINKGNAALTRVRLKSVGVKNYIWRSVHDSRVRPEHVEYDGNTYSFTGSGSKNQAPDGDPGTPVRCRCRAEGIFTDLIDEELEAGGVTNKSIIWGEADKAWEALGKPQELKQVLAMRKQLMTTLAQVNNIPKTTASVELGKWQQARVSGLPAKPAKVKPLTPPVKPPQPAPVGPVAQVTPPVPPANPLAPAPEVPITDGSITMSPEVANWHRTAFTDAPKAIKDYIRKRGLSPSVTYVTKENGKTRGAYCSYWNRKINMAEHRAGRLRGDAVWRHEFGHYLDEYEGRKVGTGAYRSSGSDFQNAMAKDASRLMKAHDVQTISTWNSFSAVGEDYYARAEWLRERYAALGINYDKFRGMLSRNSAIDFVGLNGQRDLVFAADALEQGKFEDFFQWIAGVKDTSVASRSLAKPNLGNLSDLIGAITREKLGGYRTGFGHGVPYYARAGSGQGGSAGLQGTEMFANMTSLYGDADARTWDEILVHLTPHLRTAYRQEIGL